jgi:hypothetical protein
MMRGLFLAAFVLVLTTPVAAKEDHPGKSLRRALQAFLVVDEPALSTNTTTTIDNTPTDVALDQPVDVVIVASPDADTVAVVVPVKDDTAPSGKAGGKSGGKGKKKKKDCKKKKSPKSGKASGKKSKSKKSKSKKSKSKKSKSKKSKSKKVEECYDDEVIVVPVPAPTIPKPPTIVVVPTVVKPPTIVVVPTVVLVPTVVVVPIMPSPVKPPSDAPSDVPSDVPSDTPSDMPSRAPN